MKNNTSKEQIQIAKAYGIPIAQAHTVNLKKAEAYFAFKATPEEQINDFLDGVAGKRN
jgi:hypothetical protein